MSDTGLSDERLRQISVAVNWVRSGGPGATAPLSSQDVLDLHSALLASRAELADLRERVAEWVRETRERIDHERSAPMSRDQAARLVGVVESVEGISAILGPVE